MVKRYFAAPYALACLRPGPTGPFLNSFAASLCADGYARRTARGHLRAAAHLGVWMQAEGLALATLDEHTFDAFTAHLPACACLRNNRGVYRDVRAGARVFLAHLRDQGVVPPQAAAGSALPDLVEVGMEIMAGLE